MNSGIIFPVEVTKVTEPSLPPGKVPWHDDEQEKQQAAKKIRCCSSDIVPDRNQGGADKNAADETAQVGQDIGFRTEAQQNEKQNATGKAAENPSARMG